VVVVVSSGGGGGGHCGGGGEWHGGGSSSSSHSGPSTPPSDSPRPSRNAECSNCKLFLGKIKVLEATIEMYMHPEQHTLNSTTLLHEVYNDMGKLGLE
ncbi:hypothetical protein Tco_1166105, partial [Tanacetum coccineum]